MARGGRSGPLASLLFAIAGFVLGLTFRIPCGNAIEITYHVTVLPLLVLTLLLLLRLTPHERPAQRPPRSRATNPHAA